MPLISFALAIASTTGLAQSVSQADQELCLNPIVRRTVAETIATWSEKFAFSKVIIGAQGKFGSVSAPRSVERSGNTVICHASYSLSKAGVSASMMAYVVAIPDLTFRLTPNGDSYAISIDDLPSDTDLSEAQAAALLARFTINDRPYPEIVAENQKRIAAASNPYASAWVTGSWILASKGGEDGQTDCGDFSAPAIFRANGDTGKIMTFDGSGQYRSMMTYRTPSGEEHYTLYKARWSLSGNMIALTNLSTRDAFSFSGGSDTLNVEQLSSNVMRVGGVRGNRYVRCVGRTDDIYGE
jgi:hypothetical protein